MKVNSFIESFNTIKIEEINNLSRMTELENRGYKQEIFRSKEVNPSNQIHSEKDSSTHKKCKKYIFNFF